MKKNSQIVDTFGRQHKYLRISLTERCNLRCSYCMPPEGNLMKPNECYMTGEEVVTLATKFASMGVEKIRLTGGEPLVRKDSANIIRELAKLPVDLGISTNGVLLDLYFDLLKDIQPISINVSLDSLNADRVHRLTRRNYYERILGNINKAVDQGYQVKMNVVVIRGENDDEVLDFIDLTKDKDIEIRFIEFMPFIGNKWDRSRCVSAEEIVKMAKDHYHEENVSSEACHGKTTTALHQVKGFKGKFGIISTVSQPFCASCDRIRLTADGKIRNCLFSETETDLLGALRNGEDVEPLILQCIANKHERWGGREELGELGPEKDKIRSMTSIGG